MSAGRSSRAQQAVPGRRATMAMRVVLAVGSLLLVAFVLRALTAGGGASAQQTFATWISDAIVLSAVAVCLWRAAIESEDRALWGLAGLGIASWGLGNAYFEHMLAAGNRCPTPPPPTSATSPSTR